MPTPVLTKGEPSPVGGWEPGWEPAPVLTTGEEGPTTGLATGGLWLATVLACALWDGEAILNWGGQVAFYQQGLTLYLARRRQWVEFNMD